MKERNGGTCSYSSAEGEGKVLFLTLFTLPGSAGSGMAKRLCQKLIREIGSESDLEQVKDAPEIGDESAVAATPSTDASGGGQEIAYVAAWRSGEACVNLGYGGESGDSVRPLSEFIELAQTISEG